MNKVILMGRLTKDIELRYTQNTNMAVASFSLAVDRKFVKEGEERQTDFFNIVAWGKLAETASKYLCKGTQILLAGKLQNRSWEDQNGLKKYVTEVVAEEFDFVESKKAVSNDDVLNSPTVVKEKGNNDDSDDTITDADDLPF